MPPRTRDGPASFPQRTRPRRGASSTARLAAGRTQTELVAVVGTSQAQIARIDKGDADCRLSWVERYAAALGFDLRYQLVPSAAAQPPADD